MPEVRLIGEDGKQVGVIKTSEALSYAQQRDLDLVEVAPEARPPVVRVLDYSKYKYEQAQKQKAARKHQQQITIREIKFRPKIAQNDYDTKKGHVTRFLLGKDKVKITIMFRGREVTHPERGTALLDKLAGELSEIAVIEQTPLQDGRNMTMLLAPSKAVLAGEKDKTSDGETKAQGKPADEDTSGAASEASSAEAETADGEAEAKPTATGDTAAPSDTAATDAPGTGDAADAPGTGDATDAPGTGDSTDAPATGDATDAPATGDAAPGADDGQAPSKQRQPA